MDCRQALTSLADMSAESLEAPRAQELMRHLEQCPECEEEWETFQSVMFRLSTASQPLPSPEQSRRIWAACLEEVSRDVEAKRQAALGHSGSPGFFNIAPRWSWALLGGAAAVFGAVWALAPSASISNTTPVPTQFASLQTPPSLMSALVNHHAAFAFDAFNDHTGTSLVSMGSTADPQVRAVAISTPTTLVPIPDNSTAPSSPTASSSTP